jgi:hypothetical protein
MTPLKRDHVWYIKWLSALVIIIAMVFHVNGWTPYNSYLQLLGASGWTYVGYRWREWSMIVNFVPQFLIIIPFLIYALYIKP